MTTVLNSRPATVSARIPQTTKRRRRTTKRRRRQASHWRPETNSDQPSRRMARDFRKTTRGTPPRSASIPSRTVPPPAAGAAPRERRTRTRARRRTRSGRPGRRTSTRYGRPATTCIVENQPSTSGQSQISADAARPGPGSRTTVGVHRRRRVRCTRRAGTRTTARRAHRPRVPADLHTTTHEGVQFAGHPGGPERIEPDHDRKREEEPPTRAAGAAAAARSACTVRTPRSKAQPTATRRGGRDRSPRHTSSAASRRGNHHGTLAQHGLKDARLPGRDAEPEPAADTQVCPHVPATGCGLGSQSPPPRATASARACSSPSGT